MTSNGIVKCCKPASSVSCVLALKPGLDLFSKSACIQSTLVLSHGKETFLLKPLLCSLLFFWRFPPTWFSHLSNMQFSGSHGAWPLSQLASTVFRDGSHRMHCNQKWSLVNVQTYCLCECERVKETKRELCDTYLSCIDTRRGCTTVCYRSFYLDDKIFGRCCNLFKQSIDLKTVTLCSCHSVWSFPMVFSHRQKLL